MPVRPLSPASLLRGAYYYFVSALAAIWILSLHTIIKPTKRLVRRARDLLVGCLCGRDRGGCALRSDQQAALSRAHAKLNLPLYEHQRDYSSSAAAAGGFARASGHAGPDCDAPWSLSACPLAHRTLTTRDGTRLTYHVLFPGNPRVIVLASGLGFASDFTVFSPLVHRYGRVGGDFSFISWNYRGLFSSRSDGAPRRLAIPNHAEDLVEIMQREGYRTADLIVGHSCGVQIAIEFASVRPDLVQRLVLINGTYGNVFDTALQPLFRVPFLSSCIAFVIETLIDRPHLLRTVAWALRPALFLYVHIYRRLWQSETMEALLGPNYFKEFLDGYVYNALSSEEHSRNYLRLFQELNAHSAYHLLREIRQPTLVISGLLDVLTPAYLGFEMARRLPRGRHVVAKLSAHVALLEQPELVIREISVLLERTPLPPDVAELAAGPPRFGARREEGVGADSCLSPFSRAAALSSLLHPPPSNSNPWRGRASTTGASRENSHSRARMSTSYFPHDSDEEAFEHVDDHAALQFEVTTEAAEAEAEAEAAHDRGGSAELFPEDIPTQAELDQAAAMLQAASAVVSASAATTASAVAAPSPAPAQATAAPGHTGQPATVTFDPSLPPPAAHLRPVAVLTCADQGHRKHDDEALMRHLRAAHVPAEHVVWHAPPRPWTHYRAVVVRSVWGYYLRPAEWEATLAAIEAAGVPCANSVAALRWNSNKVYLRDMAAAREAELKAGAAAASWPFDFIPTEWLGQADLARPAQLERLLIARGWSAQGAVLKPTSSAGGFGTVRLPTPGNASFGAAVRAAHDRHVQPSRPDAGAGAGAGAEPTWMMQPFQAQIVADGEFSFFFLLSPDAGPGDDAAAEQGQSRGPHLRFIHAGQKRPAAGSFLVQPINGGLLTPWHPSPAQIDAARAILRATPFGAPSSRDLLYVRVDCIRAFDESTGRPDPAGKFLLMEVEAVEPDFYSHLTPGFDALYFDAVKVFLCRAGVWDLGEACEKSVRAADDGAAQAKTKVVQEVEEEGATVGAGAAAAVVAATGAGANLGVRTPPRAPRPSTNAGTPGSVRAAAAAFAALAAAASAPSVSAPLVHDPASHVGQLIEHFEHVVEEETAKAAPTALPLSAAASPAKAAAAAATVAAAIPTISVPAAALSNSPISAPISDEISAEPERPADAAVCQAPIEPQPVVSESESASNPSSQSALSPAAEENASEVPVAEDTVAAAAEEGAQEAAAAPAADAGASSTASGTAKKKKKKKNKSKAHANAVA